MFCLEAIAPSALNITIHYNLLQICLMEQIQPQNGFLLGEHTEHSLMKELSTTVRQQQGRTCFSIPYRT